MARRPDHALLQPRHVLGRHLDPEIAARDHDAVGEIDDLVEPVDRGGLLDLDHDRGPAGDQAAGLGDVVGPLHEAEGDPVGAQLEAELQVLAILVGDRGDAQDHHGQIDALGVRERAAGDHRGLERIVGHRGHAQPDPAVVEQQLGVRRGRPEDLGMRQADPALVARRGVTIEPEPLARGQLDPALLKPADPQLGPLQVDQDRDRPSGLLLDRAHGPIALGVLIVGAVRQVQAEGVGAGLEQAADPLDRGAGRAERCENLGASSAAHG
jgi:hypothetical protein